MKYLIALIFTGFLLYGCGDKTEDTMVDEKNKFAFDSTDIQTTQAENPDETFRLKYQLEKGKKYSYRLTTIAKDAQVIQADTLMKHNVAQNIIYLFDLTNKEIDDDGVMEIECNIKSVRLDAQANEQSFTYESGKADSAEQAKYSEYEALVNNPFSLRVSSLGEIVEIFRIDKVLNKYLSLKGYADSVTVEEKNMLRREIAEGAIRPLMIQVFREVPDRQIAKDSSWTKAQPESQFMIFKTQNTNKYEIENLEMLDEDKIAVIDAGLITNISGDTKYADRGVSYEFEKPITSASGKIYFNISDGLIQKSKTKTLINISYTMEMQTPQGNQRGSKKETIENVNILERI